MKLLQIRKPFFVIIFLLVAMLSNSKGLLTDSTTISSNKTYYPDVIAATLYPIEKIIDGRKAQIGMKVEVILKDGSTDAVIYNFSKPEDMGKGKNVMVLNGVLDGAYTSESLECFLMMHNISLMKISKEEAIKLNNPNAWIWINNTFYQFIDSELSDEPKDCKINDLKVYANWDYISPSRVFPRKVTIELVSEIHEPFFGVNKVKPTILFFPYGDPVPEKLEASYNNGNKDRSITIPLENGKFEFEEELLLESKNSYLFPFDTLSAKVYGISPPIINEKELNVSGNLLNLEGIALFEKDKITIRFNRKPSYILAVVFSDIILIILFLKLKRTIKYIRKKSIRKSLFKIILWDYCIPIVGSVAVVTFSYKFLFNILTIIPMIILIQIGITLFKKFKKFTSDYKDKS